MPSQDCQPPWLDLLCVLLCLQASSVELKNIWVSEIRKVLTGQLEACRGRTQSECVMLNSPFTWYSAVGRDELLNGFVPMQSARARFKIIFLSEIHYCIWACLKQRRTCPVRRGRMVWWFGRLSWIPGHPGSVSCSATDSCDLRQVFNG